MKPFRLAFLAAACAAFPALAQTAAPAGAAPFAAAPSTGAPAVVSPGTTTTNPSLGGVPGPSLPGTNTNPTFGTTPGATAGGLGTTPGAAAGGIGSAGSSSVAAQAQQRRQLALQQCQSMIGSSRSDCIRSADDDFTRAVGTDQLAQQGQGGVTAGMSTPGVPETGAGNVAGSTRSTPDLSPTPRDNTFR